MLSALSRAERASLGRAGATSAQNVLVAVEDGARRRVRSVLATSRLTFVSTRARLQECVGRERFSLALVGAGFDCGRPGLALEAILRDAPAVAVICAFLHPSTAWSYSEFRSACLELGAWDTLDFTRWRDDPEGNASLRALLESALR